MRSVVAILQARMGSARLPGKVLAPLAGAPMLVQILRRLAGAKTLSRLVVATSDCPADDAVAETAASTGAAVFRGSENDVLDRFTRAARLFDATDIVRLTGDNPLVDAAFVDMVVARYFASNPAAAYADTATSATWPYGLSVEAFSREALECAWEQATSPDEREHVTPWIRAHGESFPALHLRADRDDSDLRWTVDLPSDLDHIRSLFTALDLGHSHVDYQEVIRYERRQKSVARLTSPRSPS